MPRRGALTIIELSSAPLGGLFNIFLPIHQLWWAVLGLPLSWGLSVLYDFFAGVPVLNAIGAYGLAIIAVTLIIKLVLSPLYEYQIRAGRKTMLQQRALAPELGELRKKFKGDPQRLNQATMELYRERGINPLSSMSGCLPTLIQLPILSALYWVFRDAHLDAHVTQDNFLFIPHLNAFASSVPWIHGLPVPAPAYLVLPLLAAGTTFIQSRMMQQPKNPVASEQEQSTATMMKSMQFLMPVMILVFSIQVPAGLALYWFVSNCFAIGQQYRVNGWGGMRPKEQVAEFEKALQEAGYGPGPRSSATGDKIVAKRSSGSRVVATAAAGGAAAAGASVANGGAASRGARGGSGNGNGPSGGSRSDGSPITDGKARASAGSKNGAAAKSGKGGAKPPVSTSTGGQRARSQPAGAGKRPSSKRTRKPTR